MNTQLPIVGRTTTAAFPAEGIVNVPVKVDTGADSSSIWASHLDMDDDGTLKFILFADGSPYFSGQVHETKEYSVHRIRSSNGTMQVRYKVKLAIQLAGRTVRGTFTLADRSQNTYPVLIGCSLLKGKFLVDVSKQIRVQQAEYEGVETGSLSEELAKDPKAFFEKYHAANLRGDITL